MLTYQDTLYQILALEKRIKTAEKSGDKTMHEYAEHSRRLLEGMIIEHRKAAIREKEYPMR